jgi:hypothetical protein
LQDDEQMVGRSLLSGRQSAQSSGAQHAATLFGAAAAETILASGHVPHEQAGHMDARSSMPFSPVTTCKQGAVHKWIAAALRASQ